MPQAKLLAQFEEIFRKLLDHGDLAPHEADLSMMFEALATNLLARSPNHLHCYFDGVTGMVRTIRSPREIEFQGEMWVGRDQSQWTEPFWVKVVDKRITKQGIWIKLSVGQDPRRGRVIVAPSVAYTNCQGVVFASCGR